MQRAARFLGALVAFVALPLRAQCPDGSPPPCRSAGSAALSRRANPPLNERAWIVVPFANVTRAVDLDWLRDASVNLLTLDLTRWTDISVIDDKHIADLLRELPASRGAQSLSLNDGLTLARRAGAGKLVMGDYFKLGRGARIVANVFDVKSGAKLRSATTQVAESDSLLSAFGPLARGVLAVPPPPDAAVGAMGTTRVDAYQEYLLGVTALNRFEITEAEKHLTRALALDSGFALAHYKLAVAIHWNTSASDTTERSHAQSAARLAGALPPRERALINARLALANGEYERSCAAVRALVARDSSDVEALYAVGECEYHGGYVAGTPIDSAHGTFRGNWNRAIAAFRRVLVLDPTYHPAFAHVLEALSASTVTWCATPGPLCGNATTSWASRIVRDGDSLIIRPVRTDSREIFEQQRVAAVTYTWQRNLRTARAIAQDWVDAGQREARALLYLGEVDLSLGALESASDALRQIGPTADRSARVEALQVRVQITIQRGRGAEGRALLDTLGRLGRSNDGEEGTFASYSAAFGKLELMRSGFRRIAATAGWSPERLRYMLHAPRVVLGLPDADVTADERSYWNSVPGDSACVAGYPRCRTSALLATMAYAVRVPRTWWPPLDEPPSGLRFQVAWAVAAKNPAWIRDAVHELDSLAHVRVETGGDELAMTAIATDGALAVGDSANALRLARYFTDSVAPLLDNFSVGVGSGSVVTRLLVMPRMMLQRADLAAALGHREEAREWYAKLLEMWADADDELQPTVQRIRQAISRSS